MQSSAKPAMTALRSARLQRKCACGGTSGPTGECEPCRKKRVQRATNHPSALNSESFVVPAIVDEVLDSAGQPLDAPTRAFMEPRFGHDFSQVRIHTDAWAAASTQSINATAYTVGRDVVLPNGTGDNQLLAHELAHVVQHGGRQASVGLLSISSPNDRSEREAALAAEAVSAGRSFRPTLLTGETIHRQPAPRPPATLAGLTATRDAFNNTGAPDAANCAPCSPRPWVSMDLTLAPMEWK
jgi:hypothetical protein